MNAPATAQVEPGGSSATVERVIRCIDRMIGFGELRPGDSVSEPKLTRALGVGRVPVREAIRILAGEGLLELVPNRSARVRSISPVEILEMMETLTGFSLISAHLLCQKPVDEALIANLGEIAGRITRLAKAPESTAMQLMHEISVFHYVIIRGSGNGYLLRLLNKTRMRYYSHYLVALLGKRAFVESAPRYARMIASLKKRDAQAFIRIMLKDIENSKQHARLG